jgi:hypothetical protein
MSIGYTERQWRTQEFCSAGGGVQQIQLRTEGSSGVPRNFSGGGGGAKN